MDCTTEDNEPCQFPFVWQNITFTSCTMLQDTKPWCATKVDSLKNFIPGEMLMVVLVLTDSMFRTKWVRLGSLHRLVPQ